MLAAMVRQRFMPHSSPTISQQAVVLAAPLSQAHKTALLGPQAQRAAALRLSQAMAAAVVASRTVHQQGETAALAAAQVVAAAVDQLHGMAMPAVQGAMALMVVCGSFRIVQHSSSDRHLPKLLMIG